MKLTARSAQPSLFASLLEALVGGVAGRSPFPPASTARGASWFLSSPATSARGPRGAGRLFGDTAYRFRSSKPLPIRGGDHAANATEAIELVDAGAARN
jgi:hypothetical protein